MDKDTVELFLKQMQMQYVELKADLKEDIGELRQAINQGFKKHSEIHAKSLDQKANELSEQRLKIDMIDAKLEALDRFKWKIVGLVMGLVLAIEVLVRSQEIIDKLLLR